MFSKLYILFFILLIVMSILLMWKMNIENDEIEIEYPKTLVVK